MNAKLIPHNGIDEHGYVVELSKAGHIKNTHKKFIEAIIAHLQETFLERLHSVYVYGSVATSTFKPYTSDIDITVLLIDSLTKNDKNKFMTLAKQLQLKYPIFRKIDFDPGSLQEALDEKNRYSWGFWLRHCCICVYGQNLSLQLPKLKLTKDIAEGINGDLQAWIKKYAKKIEDTDNQEDIKAHCSAIMRKMIRTGFSMVMVEEQCWTGNLNLCFKLFSKHYPEKKQEMKEILNLAKIPIEDKERIYRILRTFGKWLIKEFKSVIKNGF